MESDQAGPKLCRRCKENRVSLKIRSEPVCGPCFRRFVQSKAVKRLEVLAREFSAAPTQPTQPTQPTKPKKILVGLSFGASSTSLVNILDESIQNQLKKRPTPAYNPVAVHIDTDDVSPSAPDGSSPQTTASQQLLDRFGERYPRLRFVRVPFTAVLDLDTIDWAALPIAPGGGDAGSSAAERLQDFFARLPSATSRADVFRLFIRHILISVALREGCYAVLLGCSTTALAELTLGETAKGRGFSLPWMINDGPLTIEHMAAQTRRNGEDSNNGAAGPAVTGVGPREETAKLSIWYPNRELFRNELTTYTTLVSPPLTDLLVTSDTAASVSGAVVSHKDVSIDEVMARYCQEVEENYPSIVANVVRTTGRLERYEEGNGAERTCCGLCGMGLDELGNERWKGEIGGDDGCDYGSLCYGCSRAMRP